MAIAEEDLAAQEMSAMLRCLRKTAGAAALELLFPANLDQKWDCPVKVELARSQCLLQEAQTPAWAGPAEARV